MNNRIRAVLGAAFCIVMLVGCGKNQALEQYQADMTTFFEQISMYNDGMNSIDASAEDATNRILDYLDKVEEEIAWMAQLEVPSQFSAVEDLADEADENMKQAVALYHQAYEGDIFDEAVAQAAKEYYDRANIRIQYIITILHGEIPEGEGVTYTEENSIFGGGYLNQTEEDTSSEDTVTEPETGTTDNFDTDDTVFYEEPTEEMTQESTQVNE